MLKSFLVLLSCLVLAKGHVQPRCQLNEESRCVTSCPPEKTCENRNIKFSCLAVFEPCQNKCVCKEGYFRNPLGTCITEAQCTPANTCKGQNEEYTNKKRTCPPETCFSLVAKFKCDSKEPYQTGCVCKSGFRRKNDKSPCVPICECDEMKHSADCTNQ